MINTSKTALLPDKCMNAISREFDKVGLTLEYTDPVLKQLLKDVCKHIVYDIVHK